MSERLFGHVRELRATTDGWTLAVDPAEMLTGDEAVRAAREAGVIGPDEDLPNDFYIRDLEADLRVVRVRADAPVVLTWWRGNETATIGLAQWSNAFRTGAVPEDSWLAEVPYWFDLENGVVVSIEQQYLP